MPISFRTQELRDDLAERLATLATLMSQSRSQGEHGTVVVTDEMIDDIRTAACVVGLAEVSKLKLANQ